MKSKPTLTDLQLTRLFRANLRKVYPYMPEMVKHYRYTNGKPTVLGMAIRKDARTQTLAAIAATREGRRL